MAEQIPAYEQLEPEANEESYGKENGFLHDVLVGFEYPLAVPDKAVDHAEDIAGDVGYGVGQAQDGVEQIEHDERDERVADTDDAVFQKLYGSLFSLIVHCCGFLVFVVAENGYRPVVFYGKQADGNDGDSAGNLLHGTGKSGKHGEPVDNAAGYARRSVNFSRKLGVAIIGVIENMSGLICPHCKEEIPIFGKGGGKKMCQEMHVPFLGAIPMEIGLPEAEDEGKEWVAETGHPSAEALKAIANEINNGTACSTSRDTSFLGTPSCKPSACASCTSNCPSRKKQ